MARCFSCKRLRESDALDLDGFCFDCANPDEGGADLTKPLRELVASTVAKLADVRGTTPAEMSNELVVEHYGTSRREPAAG